MIHPGIYIDQTTQKGRGVFCRDPLPEGTLVEQSPVVVMDRKARDLLDQTPLYYYIFEWTPEGQDLCCMALGYIAVYNHAYASNCEYFMDYEQQTMMVRTIRDIAAGEELTVNYNGDWDNKSPVWFEVQE